MTATISRDEARAKRLQFYFTNIPCKHGHISQRYVSTKNCVACIRMYYAARDPEEERARCRAMAQKHKERRQAYQARWRKERPFVHAACEARRRGRKLNATPKWLTNDQLRQMKIIYETCPEGHEVDHIVPLQGELVCGLHVPWNLQHLPAVDNRRKGNKFRSASPKSDGLSQPTGPACPRSG